MVESTSINGKSNMPDENNNTYAMAVLTSLFFMWGFITCLNDILGEHTGQGSGILLHGDCRQDGDTTDPGLFCGPHRRSLCFFSSRHLFYIYIAYYGLKGRVRR